MISVRKLIHETPVINANSVKKSWFVQHVIKNIQEDRNRKAELLITKESGCALLEKQLLRQKRQSADFLDFTAADAGDADFLALCRSAFFHAD